MDIDWSWWRFLLGSVGALAPEILRLYKIVTGTSSGNLPQFGPSYILISLLFIGLGGVMAVVWGENNAFKCVWVGLSLPVIISSFGGRIPSK